MSGRQLELFDVVVYGHLSTRELEVLQLVSRGYTNAEIAGQLIISQETVKSHVRHILAKTGTRSRAHAVASALRNEVIA